MPRIGRYIILKKMSIIKFARNFCEKYQELNGEPYYAANVRMAEKGVGTPLLPFYAKKSIRGLVKGGFDTPTFTKQWKMDGKMGGVDTPLV